MPYKQPPVPFTQALLDNVYPGPFNTPPIDPTQLDINQPKPGFMQRLGQTVKGFEGDFQNPLMQFGMNLLANNGPAPIGTTMAQRLGMSGQQTLQSLNAQKLQEAQQRLIESRIGVNDAQAYAAGMPGQEKPQSTIAKLRADLQAGLIPQEVYDAEVQQILSEAEEVRFGQTQGLREEFTKVTKPVTDSLQALSAAESLIATGDEDNALAELAALISTIRSIDNSTVREGELAAFNSAMGIMRGLENTFSQARGEGFSENLRNQVIDAIQRLQAPLREIYTGQQRFYGDEASKFKLDPSSIIGAAIPKQRPASDFARNDPTAPGIMTVPPSAIEEGVTPEMWESFTDEERALWQN